MDLFETEYIVPWFPKIKVLLRVLEIVNLMICYRQVNKIYCFIKDKKAVLLNLENKDLSPILDIDFTEKSFEK